MATSFKLTGLALTCLFLTLLAGGVWSGLVVANLKTGIAFPWSVPAAAVLLWLGWCYAGGHGPPRRTTESRRHSRRANPLSGRLWIAALLANGFALAALCGLWIVLFQIVKAPGNAADFSKYPFVPAVLIVVTGAAVGAVAEEVGMRGYLQGALERVVPPPFAIFLAALALTPGHALTQGFVWSTLLFYVIVDVVFGATAYLTNSIYPGIVAHATGLVVFFALIWPQDSSRRLISAGGADMWFWIHLAQAIAFGAAAYWSFARLAKIARRRNHPIPV